MSGALSLYDSWNPEDFLPFLPVIIAINPGWPDFCLNDHMLTFLSSHCLKCAPFRHHFNFWWLFDDFEHFSLCSQNRNS